MFYDSERFPFTKDLEANWETVKEELIQLSPDDFVLWGEREAYDNPEHDTEGWRVFAVYNSGEAFPHATDEQQAQGSKCPKTRELLKRIPGISAAGFSALFPNTRINGHEGANTEVLRCHLGIHVPKSDCAIKVDGVEREWQEGKCLIFDDTYWHEAWNLSEEFRVVLLLDFLKSAYDIDD